MTDEQISIKSHITAPRWAGMKEALFEGANSFGLEYQTLEEDKGFLRTTIYFKITGSKDMVQAFFKQLAIVVNEHNES